MKVINFLPGQVFTSTQYGFNSSVSALNVRMYEANINNFKNFGTFLSLLKGKESFGDKSKDNIAGKTRDIKTSFVNASQSSTKKKAVQKTKSLTVRPEINFNDLQIKVNQIQKFISKGMSVTLKVDNSKNSEEGFEGIFSQIQKSITKQQISAKLSKTGQTIVISPIITDDEADNKTNKEKSNSSSDLNSKSEGKS